MGDAQEGEGLRLETTAEAAAAAFAENDGGQGGGVAAFAENDDGQGEGVLRPTGRGARLSSLLVAHVAAVTSAPRSVSLSWTLLLSTDTLPTLPGRGVRVRGLALPVAPSLSAPGSPSCP